MRTDRIKEFFGRGEEERKYFVSGEIIFEMEDAAINPDIAELKRSILEVDQLNPWTDELSRSENKVYKEKGNKSIFHISEGEIIFQNWSNPIRECAFNIYTQYKMVRKSQVYAYEKYLSKLAEELAKLKPAGIQSVRSVIFISSASQSYLV